MDARAIRPETPSTFASTAVACLFALLLVPSPVVARVVPTLSAPTDSVGADTLIVLLPELAVEEQRLRLERELRLRPGFASFLFVDDLPSPTATTTEALSRSVGVNVRQYGGLGAYSAVSVRGSSVAQVAVYLDGVPLTQAQYGVVNLADLPLRSLERIEVYRGAAPLSFQNPGSGVVHLVTRAVHGTEAEARISLGGFATRRADLWGTHAGEALRLYGSYRHQSSDGDFEFLDDNGTPLNLDDDEVVTRRNNGFHDHGLTAKAEWAIGAKPEREDEWIGSGGRLTAMIDALSKSAGMPGISSYQADEARFDTRRGIASLWWTSPEWDGGDLRADSRLYGVLARDRLDDRGNELGSGVQDTDDRTASWGARQEASWAVGPMRHTLLALGEARREEFRPGVQAPEPHEGPTSRRNVVSLGLEDRVAPWNGRVIVNGSWRRERAEDDFPAGPAYAGAPMRPAVQRDFANTSLAGGARIVIVGGLAVRLNASRAERLPSLFELYGNRGTVVGNRSLTPERLDHRDAGLAWEGAPFAGLGHATLEVSAYRSDARDLIVFVQNSQYASVAQNVAGARLEGIETALSLRAGAWSASGNWTHQETRDQSLAPFWRGNQLPGRPEDEASTRLEFTASRWGAFHEFHFASGNYLDRANRLPVEARQIHDLGAFWSRGAARFTAEVRNLGDDDVRDAAAYPLPGRTWSLTAEVRL